MDTAGGSVELADEMNCLILEGDVSSVSAVVVSELQLAFFFFGILNLGGFRVASSETGSAHNWAVSACASATASSLGSSLGITGKGVTGIDLGLLERTFGD